MLLAAIYHLGCAPCHRVLRLAAGAMMRWPALRSAANCFESNLARRLEFLLAIGCVPPAIAVHRTSPPMSRLTPHAIQDVFATPKESVHETSDGTFPREEDYQ